MEEEEEGKKNPKSKKEIKAQSKSTIGAPLCDELSLFLFFLAHRMAQVGTVGTSSVDLI
jgi:hypothetical protein